MKRASMRRTGLLIMVWLIGTTWPIHLMASSPTTERSGSFRELLKGWGVTYHAEISREEERRFEIDFDSGRIQLRMKKAPDQTHVTIKSQGEDGTSPVLMSEWIRELFRNLYQEGLAQGVGETEEGSIFLRVANLLASWPLGTAIEAAVSQSVVGSSQAADKAMSSACDWPLQPLSEGLCSELGKKHRGDYMVEGEREGNPFYKPSECLSFDEVVGHEVNTDVGTIRFGRCEVPGLETPDGNVNIYTQNCFNYHGCLVYGLKDKYSRFLCQQMFMQTINDYLYGRNCTCTDKDFDNFWAERNCGTHVDCDDLNPQKNPGMIENCQDHIDNDCNGMVDMDDWFCQYWCTDTDGDGYYGKTNCGTAVDCNDQDAGVHPGAVEICTDGRDNNCNGLTDMADPYCKSQCPDKDKDGYYGKTNCGTAVDCNDQDAGVHPGAVEICDDGKDNDCDGKIDSHDSDCAVELPDLTIVGVWPDSATKDRPVDVCFLVKNIGKAPVNKPWHAKLYRDGQVVGEYLVTYYPKPNEEKWLCHRFDSVSCPPSGNVKRVEWFVDSKNEIIEANEGNNRASWGITINGCESPPPVIGSSVHQER